MLFYFIFPKERGKNSRCSSSVVGTLIQWKMFSNYNVHVNFHKPRKHIFKVSVCVWGGAIARKSASNCVLRRLSRFDFSRLWERPFLSLQQNQVGGLGLRAQLAATLKGHGPLASHGCCDKVPQTQGLKAAEIHSLTAMKARNPKLIYQQDWPFQRLRGALPSFLSVSTGCHNPGVCVAWTHITPISACLRRVSWPVCLLSLLQC